MARPREFDWDKAIDGAMQIFWENGYGATNLPDLLNAMGLTRGSFYKAFHDKKSVYLEALKRYEDIHIGGGVALLSDPSIGTGRARLLKLFKSSLNDDIAREDRRGCLMCNAIVELGPTDAEVAQITARMCASMQQAVYTALGDNNPATELTESERQQQSIVITNLYFGAQALSKSGKSAPDWEAILDTVTT